MKHCRPLLVCISNIVDFNVDVINHITFGGGLLRYVVLTCVSRLYGLNSATWSNRIICICFVLFYLGRNAN